jgi:ubiquinone/menaquinone biosynthesis C-methylase UbiE
VEGVSHDLSAFPDASFDIVTVSFVFHWVDRSKLLQTVSECDRVLKDGGLLAIQDFFPAAPQRRMYHRNPELGVFTYKQVYSDIFRASNIYTSVFRMNFLHPNAEHMAWDRRDDTLKGGDDHGFLEVLKKDLNGNYPIKDEVMGDRNSPMHQKSR